MARITGLEFSQLEEHKELFDIIDATYGFVPNSFRTLGRAPAMLAAVGRLGNAIMIDSTETTVELRWLVAHVSSRAAGCRYCASHSAMYSARVGGASEAKLEAVWEFQTSELFTPAERSALNLALAAGVSPNAATDEHFDDLHLYYSDDAIAEIVAVIALFGFFNRWNDTLATDLEDAPASFANRTVFRSQAAASPGADD